MEYALNDFISDVTIIKKQTSAKLTDFEVPFKKYLRSNALFSTINTELARTLHDPLYTSANLRGNNLMIHAEDNWVLLYTLYEHVPAHLYTLPIQSLISPLGNGQFEYDIYDLPKTYINSLFDPNARLLNKRSFNAGIGDVVMIEGANTVIDVRITQPVGVLKLIIPRKDYLQWAFDRQTLTALQAISATPEGSELAFIAQVLSALKNQNSLFNLKRLAQEHPEHNVRWEAVKAIGKINPEIGIEVIKAATMDMHPHVAEAAQKTLARYLAS